MNKKSKKFGHIISLSKQFALEKQFKFPTSIPSPRNSPTQSNPLYQIFSPKQEEDSLLNHRNLHNKSNQITTPSSNYLTSAESGLKISKHSFMKGNSSIKSQLLLSNVDTSLLPRESPSSVTNLFRNGSNKQRSNKKSNNISVSTITANATYRVKKDKANTAMCSRKNSNEKINKVANHKRSSYKQACTLNVYNSSNNIKLKSKTTRIICSNLNNMLSNKGIVNTNGYINNNNIHSIGLRKECMKLFKKSKSKVSNTACSSPSTHQQSNYMLYNKNSKDMLLYYNNHYNSNANSNSNSNTSLYVNYNKSSKNSKIIKSKSIQFEETKAIVKKYFSKGNHIKLTSSNKHKSTSLKSKQIVHSHRNAKIIPTSLLNIHLLINPKNKFFTKQSKPSSKSKAKLKNKKKSNTNANSKQSNTTTTTNNSIPNAITSKINELQCNYEKEVTQIRHKALGRFQNIHNDPFTFNKPNKERNSLNSFSNQLHLPSSSSPLPQHNNFYMNQSLQLQQYIKDKYISNNNTYPKTELSFYLYGRLIGQGAFGKVNLGLNVLSGRVVAVKSFCKQSPNYTEKTRNKILYETNLMKKLNHPSIVKILETFETNEYMLIIMEYINGGNLYSFVKKRRKLSEQTAKMLFWQITQGIRYMHSVGVVHRDIKLENILIDLYNNVKICDFGIGKVLPQCDDDTYTLHEQCGTPMYIAPEILLSTCDNGYKPFPVDMWSSGIALYIMLSGTLPFIVNNNNNCHKDDAELQYAILNSEPKEIDGISSEAKDLLMGLLDKNPSTRYTSNDVLNHSWFKDDVFKYKYDKYQLFTKAEIMLLSKTYIDYRLAKAEELIECFTMSNLKNERDGVDVRNNNTKSVILAPFNSLVTESANTNSVFGGDRSDSFVDLLQLKNNVLVFDKKVKEFNLNYEMNNNGEIDNGVFVNSKFDFENKVTNVNDIVHNETSSYKEEEQQEHQHCKRSNTNECEVNKESSNKTKERMLLKMEELGYNRAYMEDVLTKGELCYASAVYFLLENYEHI